MGMDYLLFMCCLIILQCSDPTMCSNDRYIPVYVGENGNIKEYKNGWPSNTPLNIENKSDNSKGKERRKRHVEALKPQALPKVQEDKKSDGLFLHLRDTVAEDNYSSGDLETYYVELFLVLDFSIYETWYNQSKGKSHAQKRRDSIDNIRYYFIHVVEGVDSRYRTIDESMMVIRIKLAGLYIAVTENDSPWTVDNIRTDPCEAIPNCTWTFVHAYHANAEFQEWVEEKRKKLPQLDHAVLVTRYMLAGVYYDKYGREYDKRKISGTTEIRGICTHWKTSIIQDIGLYGTTQTMAHELGHNLGAYHDGYKNDCNGEWQYIMAADPDVLKNEIFLNPLSFSNCSVEEIHEWMHKITAEGDNCLLNPAEHIEVSNFRKQANIQPGLLYSLDAQCKYLYGETSYYCRISRVEIDICRELYCYMPSTFAKPGCFTTNELRAYSGTSCGDRMWCEQGQCVEHPDAPSIMDICKGEYEGLFTTGETCQQLVREIPRRCYNSPYIIECCQSCKKMAKTQYPGCEFGDHEVWCQRIQSRQCYEAKVRKTCCETCRHLETGLIGCKYGDHASWCSAILESECYANEHLCCLSCSLLRRSDPSCPYGDKSFDCQKMDIQDCYYIDDQCCDTCSQNMSTSNPLCPYGDRKKCEKSNCINPGNWRDCCETCKDERLRGRRPTRIPTNPTIPTIRPTTRPTVSPRIIRSTSRPIRILNSREPTVDISFPTETKTESNTDGTQVEAPSISQLIPYRPSRSESTTSGLFVDKMKNLLCKKSDEPKWCGTIRPRECYTNAEQCCYTCNKLNRRDHVGCEYGDRVNWCELYITQIEECAYPHMEITCCLTCRVYVQEKQALSTTSINPQPVVIRAEDCHEGDEEYWCRTMHSSLCYETHVKQVCCQVCLHYKSLAGKADCEYGDKQSWCATVTAGDCQRESIQQACCSSCV